MKNIIFVENEVIFYFVINDMIIQPQDTFLHVQFTTNHSEDGYLNICKIYILKERASPVFGS